jgi:quercetin dioxygenase-like cupin family protein
MPIGLAPNAYSSFDHHVVDNDAVDASPEIPLPFNEGVTVRGYSAFNQPNCQVIIEDFMPGPEFAWQFSHDEMQYCISGEAEMEVFMPPLFSETKKVHIRPGSVYSFPVGARMHVKVIGDQPCRHIAFCPPSPNYPFPKYEDVKT